MRKMLLTVSSIVALLAVLVIGGASVYFFVLLPRDIPAPDLVIERTPARIARGEYLATAVFGCMYCHSERDWTLFGGPPKPGTLGKGGEVFDEKVGVLGRLIAANITPAGIGDWSDGEVYRAIVNGLHRDGYAMFPIMPYDAYLHLETEDVYSIIAYLRTLPPIEADHTGRKLGLLMSAIANTRVQPADPWVVDKEDPVSRGKYLAVIAGCRFCHTPADERMQARPGMDFAGGLGLVANGETVYSANISPDTETGIGNWTVAYFIARFKDYENMRIPVSAMGYQTQHAWTEYARMSRSDLADIYAYLRSQAAVRNAVSPRAPKSREGSGDS